jgi:hypothetical protein
MLAPVAEQARRVWNTVVGVNRLANETLGKADDEGVWDEFSVLVHRKLFSNFPSRDGEASQNNMVPNDEIEALGGGSCAWAKWSGIVTQVFGLF